jgi:peptidoglycan-N-acetylglucosamine deacetylase
LAYKIIFTILSSTGQEEVRRLQKPTLLILFLFILLSGCTNDSVSSEGSSQEKNGTLNPHKKEEETSSKKVNGNSNMKKKQEEPVVQDAFEAVSPQYRLNAAKWSVQPISKANPNVVLLTFDDAPDRHALDIAKTLHKLNVKAIFFVNGHFITSNEGKLKLKQIHQMGFPIGNHTFNHISLKGLSEQEQFDEIVKLNDSIEAIIGERPKFFRAPFGINTDYSKKVVSEEKMLLMNWTYGYDWEKEYQDKESLTKIMVNSPYLVKGANLLMHDREWTSEAIPDIIKGLQDKGYSILDPGLIETPK